jgi:hypothetical protein
MTADRTLTLRPATAADAPDLHRLAQLDSARDVTGDILVAELDGSPALALDDDRVVADPFTYSAEAVALLRARAATRTAHTARSVRRLALSGAG